MTPLTPEHRQALRAYLLDNELDTFLMLAHLDAAGMGEHGNNPRAGTYYRQGGSVLALYPEGTACAFLPDRGALGRFAALLSSRRVTRLYATPLEGALALDRLVTGKGYHYALTEDVGVQKGPLPAIWPQGFELKRLQDEDEAGFAAFTRIYNLAQEETSPPSAHQNMARAMRPPEGLYLGAYEGRPCLTMAAEAATPHYLYIGGAGTLPQMRGKGLAQAALAHLCLKAQKQGLQGLNLVARDNLPSRRVMEKCGYQFLADKAWRLIWYEG